ncbi:YdaS family helix-turn-helix protein [Herbaspirillum sp. ST 5-3]|uniref:transcriptional regulator n=1 Tax=Oxalobacteraceae TaxID=75682 RepID=UPI0010A3F6CA|nr:YdaS family helix-turn-helix protein [Herbaspirillum sp. ST 5-3]
METLRIYLNSLRKEQRTRYVTACGTTEGYLRKAISINQQIGADLCIALERESSGAVPCESLRPDVDWAYIRASRNVPQENALAGQFAMQGIYGDAETQSTSTEQEAA